MKEKLQMEKQTINATYLDVIKLLESRGTLIIESIPINHGRYFFIKTDEGNYLVVFKRDFFNSFGRIFAQEGETGVGETLNLEDLKIAVLKGAKGLFFTYPDGKIYSVSIEEFLQYSHKRTNDFEGKETRSINIKYLKREN